MPSSARPSRSRLPSARAAFTLVELMVAMTLAALVIVAALSGVIALQKSYAATENFANGLADQMRLLDSLAMDLRRATAPPLMDADGQGIQITVPSYYRFDPLDVQHLYPIPNTAIIDLSSGKAQYQDPAQPGAYTQTIAYRFNNGAITRTDPWARLALDPVTLKFVPAPPAVIASHLAAFPNIVPVPGNPGAPILRYSVVFYSTFQPFAVPDPSNTNTITLHNVTFVRSENLAH